MIKKFRKKDLDYIDSSVFLGFALGQSKEAKKYLDTVGYKTKNKGFISHFVMSEIFSNVFLKIKSRDKNKQTNDRKNVFELVEYTFTKLLDEGKLTLRKLDKKIDFELVNELFDSERNLTYDDALHLAVAIQENCNNFVTTDKEINELSSLKERLSKSYEMKIKYIKLD